MSEQSPDILDELLVELGGSKRRDVRTAAEENRLRNEMAEIFELWRKRNKLSIRSFAKRIGTSKSQAQRILNREQGGNLTLRTLVRAADALGLRITVRFRAAEWLTFKERVQRGIRLHIEHKQKRNVKTHG